MTDRISKSVLIGAVVLGSMLLLAYLAYSRPGYFVNQTYLGGIVLFEFLFAAIWGYRRVFFPIVIVTFLLAGVDLPVGGIWTAARWFFLCAGALVGSFIMLKERLHHFGLFHALATFAILAAMVSAAVSRYPGFALLKAVSLLLLFLYAATGARLAVTGRETRFFRGLLTGCEVFVGALAVFYFLGMEVMGNPNSLGAVMGVAGAPILLWGTMLPENPFVHKRRLVLYALSMYLVFQSHSRAGMIAAFLSCGLLCVALRRYKMLGQGVVIILIVATASAIIDPEAFSKTVSTLTSSVVYKGKDPELGLLSSRQTPWQGAVESIRSHFWFGSGFGTTDTGEDASAHLSAFETTLRVSRENGSSYLTIATWVGMLGVAPFLFLLLALLVNVFRTILWMLNTANPSHPAIPLAMVMVAGLLHAGFEDWLFAPGYYLTVFFWSLAFVLADLTPSAPLPKFSLAWQHSAMRQGVGRVVPSR